MDIIESGWSDLPNELLETILVRLPLSCHPCFASVCKSWNLITSTVYPADVCPLLAHFKKWRDGNFQYYSPLLKKTFKVDCALDLSNARSYFSKDGWLLLYQECQVILANPLSNVMHTFPGLPPHMNFDGIAFSGNPRQECTIFAIAGSDTSENYVLISYWDGNGWNRNHRFENDVPFSMVPYTSPVECHGGFYCLGKSGNLGLYDVEKNEWSVLARCPMDRFPYKVEESHLMESRGEIFGLVISNHNATTQLFKLSLNRTRMLWETTAILKSEAMFFGPSFSLVTTCESKGIKSAVYSTRFLGVPETIEAEVRHCQGRIYFVEKPCASRRPRSNIATDVGVSLYSFQASEHSSRFCEYIEYPCSIWYKPKILSPT